MKKLEYAINIIKTIFIKTCVMFTLVTIAFTVLAYTIMPPNTSSTFAYFMYILLFSLLLSLSSLVFRIKSLPGAAVRILHFILAYGSFAVSFFLVGQIIKTSQTILFVSVGFIPLYIIISLLSLIFSKLARMLFGGKESYDNQFDSKLK